MQDSASRSTYSIYLPLDPHTWYPVVLRQAAVNEEVVVVVTVVVVVEVPKYSKTRPWPAGALNPGWTTKGIGAVSLRTSRLGSTSDFTGSVSSLSS
jgi:hypothetical protein